VSEGLPLLLPCLPAAPRPRSNRQSKAEGFSTNKRIALERTNQKSYANKNGTT
jgi:hypothetical protein